MPESFEERRRKLMEGQSNDPPSHESEFHTSQLDRGIQLEGPQFHPEALSNIVPFANLGLKRFGSAIQEGFDRMTITPEQRKALEETSKEQFYPGVFSHLVPFAHSGEQEEPEKKEGLISEQEINEAANLIKKQTSERAGEQERITSQPGVALPVGRTAPQMAPLLPPGVTKYGQIKLDPGMIPSPSDVVKNIAGFGSEYGVRASLIPAGEEEATGGWALVIPLINMLAERTGAYDWIGEQLGISPEAIRDIEYVSEGHLASSGKVAESLLAATLRQSEGRIHPHTIEKLMNLLQHTGPVKEALATHAKGKLTDAAAEQAVGELQTKLDIGRHRSTDRSEMIKELGRKRALQKAAINPTPARTSD